MSHSGNAPIESIEQHRKSDRFGGEVKVPRLRYRTVCDLQDCVIAKRYVGGRKERRQNVHAFPQPARRPILQTAARNFWNFRVVHYLAPWVAGSGRTACAACTTAKTLAPPFTLSPTLTCSLAAASMRTSTRDPNLINPTRSPRSTLSPTFLVKTIRRASNPAICLKTTVCPSPSTVTTFCSFCSADAAFMAFRYLPF